MGLFHQVVDSPRPAWGPGWFGLGQIKSLIDVLSQSFHISSSTVIINVQDAFIIGVCLRWSCSRFDVMSFLWHHRLEEETLFYLSHFYSTLLGLFLNSPAPGSVMIFLWTDLVLCKPQLLQDSECWAGTTSVLCCVSSLLWCSTGRKNWVFSPEGVSLPVIWTESCRLALDVKKPQTWTSAQRYPRKQICYCAVEKVFHVSSHAISVGFRY